MPEQSQTGGAQGHSDGTRDSAFRDGCQGLEWLPQRSDASLRVEEVEVTQMGVRDGEKEWCSRSRAWPGHPETPCTWQVRDVRQGWKMGLLEWVGIPSQSCLLLIVPSPSH